MTTTSPAEMWAPFEETVTSFQQAIDLIHGVFDKWSGRGSTFAWRGQVDAEWALWSSLYRRLTWSSASPPTEEELSRVEKEVLVSLHRWGLHVSDRGHLSILQQLAILQHYGAPTRLVDVTFNPLIGLWFAVEPKVRDGKPTHEDTDGRVFAVDVTKRLINEMPERRGWEHSLGRPWPNSMRRSTRSKTTFAQWRSEIFAWKPSRFDTRIAAQNGGFIFGGVPATGLGVVWPKGTSSSAGRYGVDAVRGSTSLAVRVHKLNPAAGGPEKNALYTMRIKASAKAEIRKKLQDLYGYQHSTIYPDYTGFADHATPTLRTSPP